MENEITVLVTSDYKTLDKSLKDSNFKIKETFNINDTYMIDENVDLTNLTKLDILKKCILVRDIMGIKKELLYKDKTYASNGDILSQRKVECKVENIEDATNFMKALGYKILFSIFDKCIVYSNETTELVVQLVNDKYIFIEIEDKCNYINRVYKNIDDMINDINRYNLPISKESYFVKKAELVLEDTLKR